MLLVIAPKTWRNTFLITSGNGVIIGMGKVFPQVFGAITRRMSSLYENNSYCGNLRGTLTFWTEFKYGDAPLISVW